MINSRKLHLCFIFFILILLSSGDALLPEGNADENANEEWVINIINKMQKKIPVRFEKVPLVDVIHFFSQQANVNIILDPDASNNADGTPRVVTLNLSDVSIMTALKWILRMQGDLSMEFRDDAILIWIDSNNNNQ